MRKIVCLMVLALVNYSSPSLAEQNEPRVEAAKETYLVIYRPGPKWLEGKSLAEQPLKEHGKYMMDLFNKGSMMHAGPFRDDSGGAVLLVAADEKEAKLLVTADPAVESEIFAYEIHPWKLQPWHEFAKKFKGSSQKAAPTEH